MHFERFRQGEKVWAKFAEYPYWPAQVASADKTEALKQNKNHDGLAVLFFGYEPTYALVTEVLEFDANYAEMSSLCDSEEFKFALKQSESNSYKIEPPLQLRPQKRRSSVGKRRSSVGKRRQSVSESKSQSVSIEEDKSKSESTDETKPQFAVVDDNLQTTDNKDDVSCTAVEDKIDGSAVSRAIASGESILPEVKSKNNLSTNLDVIKANGCKRNADNNEANVESRIEDEGADVCDATSNVEEVALEGVSEDVGGCTDDGERIMHTKNENSDMLKTETSKSERIDAADDGTAASTAEVKIGAIEEVEGKLSVVEEKVAGNEPAVFDSKDEVEAVSASTDSKERAADDAAPASQIGQSADKINEQKENLNGKGHSLE